METYNYQIDNHMTWKMIQDGESQDTASKMFRGIGCKRKAAASTAKHQFAIVGNEATITYIWAPQRVSIPGIAGYVMNKGHSLSRSLLSSS